MDNSRLSASFIGSLGLLSSQVIVPAWDITQSTTFTPLIEMSTTITSVPREEYYNKSISIPQIFSFRYDEVRNEISLEKDEFYETDVVEIPVIKKMKFQFKQPVMLKFYKGA